MPGESPRAQHENLRILNLIHATARGYPRAVNNLALQSFVAAYAAGGNPVNETAARSAVSEVID